jgi:transposase
MCKPKQKPLNDLSRSITPFDPNQTLISVIEMSKQSWLVAGIIPGVERQPLKKLAADENELLKLLERWRAEAEKAGHKINRIAVTFEIGRDGFWLARWLRARGIEVHVIHAASVAVSREHRRAKTDRLDTELLKRAFLGWLRGERDHCKMAAVPTSAEEDAKRPHRERETLVGEQTTIINRIKASLARLGIRNFNPKLKKAPESIENVRTPEGEPIPPNTLAELRRDMERKRLVAEQIRQIEKDRLEHLKQAPKAGPNRMVLVLMRVIGIGIETADMLVKEILSRNIRDRRAVARYVGLTGSPDESGKKRREKGLARSGNARVRKGMIQLAWRFLDFQEDSALAKWYRALRECTRLAQKDDRRPGPQTPHRLVALRPRWRRARRRDPASGTLKGGAGSTTLDGFGPVRTRDGSPMTVRGSGIPYSHMAIMPSHRMGPPPRSFRCRCASLHHGFGSLHPPNTRMWHECSCTTRGLPSNVVIPTTASVPSCSKPSRTSLRWALTRPSLTASARAGFTRSRGSRRRNGLSSRTKKLREKKKWIGPLGHPLDKNLPIQVEQGN